MIEQRYGLVVDKDKSNRYENILGYNGRCLTFIDNLKHIFTPKTFLIKVKIISKQIIIIQVNKICREW